MNVVCGWKRRLIGRLRGVTCSTSSPHKPHAYLCRGTEKGLEQSQLTASSRVYLQGAVLVKMHVA